MSDAELIIDRVRQLAIDGLLTVGLVLLLSVPTLN